MTRMFAGKGFERCFSTVFTLRLPSESSGRNFRRSLNYKSHRLVAIRRASSGERYLNVMLTDKLVNSSVLQPRKRPLDLLRLASPTL